MHVFDVTRRYSVHRPPDRDVTKGPPPHIHFVSETSAAVDTASVDAAPPSPPPPAITTELDEVVQTTPAIQTRFKMISSS